MTIKTTDGEYGVTGAGQGIYNSIAGSLGLASFLGLNANGGLLGNRTATGTGSDTTATRYDLENIQTLMAKDEEIARLQSENNTNSKIIDVFERLSSRIKEVETEMRANKDEQVAVNAQQGIYNATANSSIAVLQSQVSMLQSMTKTVIPNGSVCPGWGNVTITPATTGTTTA